MPKKKILHLITGLEIGGAENALLKTLPLLQDNFENVVCCIKGYGPIGEKLEQAGIQVTYLHLRSIIDIPLLPFRFRKVVRQFSPDILVTYLIHADLFGRIFGRIFGIQNIICSQRGALLQWEFLRSIDRFTKKLVTQYVVQTKTAQKHLSFTLALPEEKLTVIPNGIDVSFFQSQQKDLHILEKLNIPQDASIIICVANLFVNKGHRYLLEAFERLFRQKQNLYLLLVGDGPERDSLISQKETYVSKEHILLLGKRSDVPKLLKLARIFVLPTFYEGMSNAIQEAMASSLPIISSDIPENKDLLTHNVDSLLVPVKNSQMIFDALLAILTDPKTETSLKHNSLTTIKERFSIEKTCQQWTSLFEKISSSTNT